MPEEFDMAGALSDLSDGLGFDRAGDDDGAGDADPDGGTGNAPGAGSGDPGAGTGTPDKPMEGQGAASPVAGKPVPVGAPVDPAAKPVLGADGKPVAAQSPGPAGTVAPAPGPDAPPKSWSAAGQAEWASLTPAAKAEVLKREEDFHRGLDQYKADASWGKPTRDILAPYLPMLQQAGIDPLVQVKNLMGAHYTLATGSPEAKGKLLGELLATYKIDPNLVPLPEEGKAPDPQVEALRKEVQELKVHRSAEVTARTQQSVQEMTAQTDAFFADAAANPYAMEVATHMANLIEKGLAKDLRDAYDQAVWLNPVTRDKEMARRNTEAAAAQKAADEAKAEAARKASAANVKARPKSGAATGKLGSMEDTMMATLAVIKARDG